MGEDHGLQHKSHKWFFRWPGQLPFELWFAEPVTEGEARHELREHEGLRRLPNGVEVWCVD